MHIHKPIKVFCSREKAFFQTLEISFFFIPIRSPVRNLKLTKELKAFNCRTFWTSMKFIFVVLAFCFCVFHYKDEMLEQVSQSEVMFCFSEIKLQHFK